MTFHAQMASPLGRILLCSDGAHLTGLYFVGQKDCPALQGLPQPSPKADPTAGLMGGAPIKDIRVRRRQDELDLFGDADGKAGHTEALRLGPLSLMQEATPSAAADVFEQTHGELGEYFAGRRRTFSVPLHLEGTAFQKKVWKALLAIPYGEYVSYGDVALAAGLTAGHGRPVGTAVGRNPITLIVPCHRVLSSAGRLNGYTGGLERKFALLELEGLILG
ncbi:methylated-DNA--[protein]-cysteine S-methyltransferase [Pollutimonas sp. H1-120]|uniref:methylated-DNA--[protein]-cysteine S-methyltransferase n=1 Tax=Pollutimonas sp. H1-120 TaxID=3148824 RepID=UPI003B52989C